MSTDQPTPSRRGRPPLPPSQRKPKLPNRTAGTWSDEDWAIIEQAARLAGHATTSAWIRSIILPAARRVIKRSKP